MQRCVRAKTGRFSSQFCHDPPSPWTNTSGGPSPMSDVAPIPRQRRRVGAASRRRATLARPHSSGCRDRRAWTYSLPAHAFEGLPRRRRLPHRADRSRRRAWRSTTPAATTRSPRASPSAASTSAGWPGPRPSARSRTELATQLQQPLVVRYEKTQVQARRPQARRWPSTSRPPSTRRSTARAADNLLTRTVRGLTGGTIDEDLDVERQLRRGRRATSSSSASRASSTGRPATPRSTSPPPASRPSRSRPASGSTPASWPRRSSASSSTPDGQARAARAHVSRTKPKVTTDELAEEYPSVIVVDRSTFQPAALREPQADAELHGRASAPPATTRRSASTRSRTSRSTRTGTSRTPTGRAASPARSIPPGPSNPLKSRWMGIYNGAGIHGTDATYSLGSRRLARLRAHGDPRRRGALRARRRRHARLHRLTRRRRSPCRRRQSAAITSGGTSSQPLASREAWWSEWRMHRAPMCTPSCPLAHDRVPQRRRVARTLDPVPGRAAGRRSGRRCRSPPAAGPWRSDPWTCR